MHDVLLDLLRTLAALDEASQSGEGEGPNDGAEEILGEGFDEGLKDCSTVGCEDGSVLILGSCDGPDEGSIDNDGMDEGFCEGKSLGPIEGSGEGLDDGKDEGFNELSTEGSNVGSRDGWDDGSSLGNEDGASLGCDVPQLLPQNGPPSSSSGGSGNVQFVFRKILFATV